RRLGEKRTSRRVDVVLRDRALRGIDDVNASAVRRDPHGAGTRAGGDIRSGLVGQDAGDRLHVVLKDNVVVAVGDVDTLPVATDGNSVGTRTGTDSGRVLRQRTTQWIHRVLKNRVATRIGDIDAPAGRRHRYP